MNPRELVERLSVRNVVCCFSGGKDSLVATHFIHEQLEDHASKKHVVFVDTTVMCPGTEGFVKDTASRFGWDLQILRPEKDFWTLAERWGAPRMFHRWCCFKLKLEPVKEFVSTLRRPRMEVTGLRRSESIRRRNLVELFYLSRGQVWKYAPIVSWSEADVLRYMREHSLPMPPHYALGIKETCLCGAFSGKKQMMNVRANFPEFFDKFVELEKKFRKGGAVFYFNDKPCYARDMVRQQLLPQSGDASEMSFWRCHVCGKQRPDDKISVLSKPITLPDGRIIGQQNVRYCNDNPSCQQQP